MSTATIPPVPDDVQAALAPLLAAGVTTAAAAERLHMSRTDAWHMLDNLRLAGVARLCPCGTGVLWCCAIPSAQQKGSNR
ncbi:hypothetical protein [Nonomuraea gerenzanensis]|uniref:Uncharacterized protein n=1 Tax=Nonomuraea gerenzanensis TaxID=93944 RepID=A0A1M4BKX5_9ACTN|nr:hypothetical protein [Nonomuraea gerenzanensis]UBU10060.1 hypothetical protein LCN96_37665 [Nonomuraea gerenzanensis]SAP16315.1 hypothetical protein BN4615_P10978 [Nonomuraea gerenzanensis]